MSIQTMELCHMLIMRISVRHHVIASDRVLQSLTSDYVRLMLTDIWILPESRKTLLPRARGKEYIAQCASGGFTFTFTFYSC